MFVLLFTECSVAESLKKPSSTNSSQECPTTQQGEGCTLGLTKEQPADSCYHTFTCNPRDSRGCTGYAMGPRRGRELTSSSVSWRRSAADWMGSWEWPTSTRVSPAPPAHHHWHSTGPTVPRSVDLQSDKVVIQLCFQCMGWSTTMSVAEQWGTRFINQ